MSIGARIRELRIRAGLTPAELYERAGLTQSYLSELENGRYDLGDGADGPTLRTLLKIAAILGCRIENFLGDGDYPEYDARKYRLSVPPILNSGRREGVRSKYARRISQLINRLDEDHQRVALRVLGGYVRGVSKGQSSSGSAPPAPRTPSEAIDATRGKRREG